MRARGPKAKPEGKGWEVRWRQVWAEPRKGIQPKLCMETTVVSKEVQELRDRIGVSGADIGHVWREGRVRGPTWGKRDTERGIPPTRHNARPEKPRAVSERGAASLPSTREPGVGFRGRNLPRPRAECPIWEGGARRGFPGPGGLSSAFPRPQGGVQMSSG